MGGRLRARPRVTITYIESTITLRARIMASTACILVIAGHMTQGFFVSAMPYLLFICGACWLPQGPPPTHASAMLATALSIGQASTYIALGIRRWQSDAVEDVMDVHDAAASCRSEDPKVHLVRSVISFVWAFGFICLSAHVLYFHCAHFWTALRCVIGACSALRLVSNIFMYWLDAQAGCYLPGNVSFFASVSFNVACIALVVVVLESKRRRALSEWTGGGRVVLNLAQVPEEAPVGPPGPALAEPADATSDTADVDTGVFGVAEFLDYQPGPGVGAGNPDVRPASRSARSAGSSAGPELGGLWDEAPAEPHQERLGSAVFYDSDESGQCDQRPTPVRTFFEPKVIQQPDARRASEGSEESNQPDQRKMAL